MLHAVTVVNVAKDGLFSGLRGGEVLGREIGGSSVVVIPVSLGPFVGEGISVVIFKGVISCYLGDSLVVMPTSLS